MIVNPFVVVTITLLLNRDIDPVCDLSDILRESELVDQTVTWESGRGDAIT